MEKKERFQTYLQRLKDLVKQEQASEKNEQLASLKPGAEAFALQQRCIKVLLFEKDESASVCVFKDLHSRLKSREMREAFSRGNKVVLKSANLNEHGVFEEGLITQLDDAMIMVQFREGFPKEIRDGKWLLYLLSSEVTWERSLDFIDAFASTSDRDKLNLAYTLLGDLPIVQAEGTPPDFSNTGLNQRQSEVLQAACAAQTVGLVFGPPGTGKTHVLAECIHHLTAASQKVLVTAPSNAALDHLLSLLGKRGIPFVRLGPEQKVEEQISGYHINALKQDTYYFDEIKRLKKERRELIEHISRKKSRNYIPTAEYKAYKQSLADMKKEIQMLEKRNLEKILDTASVIACTHAAFPGEFKNRWKFDTVIIDEASQSAPYLTWISLYLGQKVILAGDPFQLPPVLRSVSHNTVSVNSGKTMIEHVEMTLLEHLISIYPFPCMLTDQYRMQPLIQEWPSRQFYHDKLNCCSAPDGEFRENIHDLFQKEVVFIDSAGSDMTEMNEDDGSSLYNQGEASLVCHFMTQLMSQGFSPLEMGCITPYAAQVRCIREILPHESIEVNSIDGFQGREKNIMIISMVRSNVMNETGFLVDFRRFNVAVTRAKKQLIVIGNSVTLSQIPFLRQWMDWVEENGETRSVWEWSEIWMN